MAEPARWTDLSDRLNPIVVKDVRQGLRTRAFTASFGLLLAVSVLISIISWTAWTPAAAHGGSGVGEGAFVAYLCCFGFVGFLVLPLSLHRTFVKEREAETWTLLVMTGVRPRRILRGKIASGLVQGALYASAIAPFLLFSYFLQGVSLLAILLSMAAAFVWQAFLTTAAVASAAFAEQRYMRSLVGALWGLSLPFCSLLLASGVSSYLTLSHLGAAALTGSAPFSDWWVVVAVLWVFGSLGVVLFEAAAGRLMSAGENHAIGPRLATLVHLAGLLAVPFIARARGKEIGIALLCYGSFVTFVYGIFAVSDDDGASRAVRATRVPSLLWPGAFRGFVAVVVLEALVVVAALLVPGTGGDTFERLTFALPAWVLTWTAVPALLCRGLLPNRVGRPVTMRFVSLGLALTALVLVPTFLSDRGDALRAIANPFLTDTGATDLPLVVAGVLTAAAAVVLIRRARIAEER